MTMAGQPPPPRKTSDLGFIRTEYPADHFEIELCRLAIQQSPRKDIQAFARKTMHLQFPLDQNLYWAKLSLHVGSAKRLQRHYTRQLDRIRKLSGAAFDEAYLLTLLRAYRKDRETYSFQLKTTTNPTMKPVLKQGLDFYTNRLAALRKLAVAHHVTDKKSRR